MSKAQPSSLRVSAYKIDGYLYKTYPNLKVATNEFKISKAAIYKVLDRSDRICKNLIWIRVKGKKIPNKISKFSHTILRSRKTVYKWNKDGVFK